MTYPGRTLIVMALCSISFRFDPASALENDPSEAMQAGHGQHVVSGESGEPAESRPHHLPDVRRETARPLINHQEMHQERPQDKAAVNEEGQPHFRHDGDHAGSLEANHLEYQAPDDAGTTAMQGGSPPPSARGPHAYSDGYGFGPIPPPKMADEEIFSALLVDRLESVSTGSQHSMTYDFQYGLGLTYDKALIRAEGDIADGAFQNARSELLWAHAADAYWDMHLGVRYDSGLGPDRGWIALGVQGLAPYWIYIEATVYVGEQGRTAFRIEAEYDVLLTQKLILQPRIEANFYGKRDAARALGHGLSDLVVGMRLRYEFWRELAPYIGVEWAGKFGDTADYLENSGIRSDETRAIAGVQFWF
ncbi:MAG: copper resistance protein B [Gammaproteobacteria bacterium]